MAGEPEGAPRRKDAQRNRRRLLAAAREVFRDRGVAATLKRMIPNGSGLRVSRKLIRLSVDDDAAHTHRL